jgi:DNA-binding NarL/FixJ family response regulator
VDQQARRPNGGASAISRLTCLTEVDRLRTVRRRSAETRDELTPQEEQIVRLARDGLSNPEIGAQLFLSSRTVEWHLHKVYTKLGISSRRELWAASVRAAGPSSM